MCGISMVFKINRAAMDAANSGDYELAVEKLHEAIDLIRCQSKKAHRAKLYMNLALVHRMFNHNDDARESYELAIKYLNPFNRGQSILIGRIRENIEKIAA